IQSPSDIPRAAANDAATGVIRQAKAQMIESFQPTALFLAVSDEDAGFVIYTWPETNHDLRAVADFMRGLLMGGADRISPELFASFPAMKDLQCLSEATAADS